MRTRGFALEIGAPAAQLPGLRISRAGRELGCCTAPIGEWIHLFRVVAGPYCAAWAPFGTIRLSNSLALWSLGLVEDGDAGPGWAGRIRFTSEVAS